ncbi:neural-cadherin-like [Schistocerca americana]|uniref:neural-cadherin-like n=1 Tax=Schistocerca americana TaxID=7009 RepID=UPI001F4FFBF5|nr:neural-cadherin-like [Schistocerca americana]
MQSTKNTVNNKQDRNQRKPKPDYIEIGAVRYQIAAGDELGAFAVDAATGRVTVAGKLDFEARPEYELQLRATDATRGLPDGQGQARLVVRVADANDLPPAFRRTVYHAELQEEEDPSRLPIRILTVEAVDGDSGRPQDVVYSLSGPGVSPDGTGHFSIDARTGDVFLLKPVDRDPPLGRPVWRLAAFAQDEGGAGLVGHAELRVALRDVNDNAPAFLRRLYRGRVVENAPAGTIVLNVTAVDNDDPYEGLNAKITYSIEKNVVDETSGSAIFMIDSDSGEIRTAICCLDRERTPRYSIQVVATDGGGLQGTTTVSIAVKDVNDTPPEFTKDEWVVEVDETDAESLPQKPILTVTARDKDEDGAFQYAVVDDSGYGADRFALVTNSDGTGSLKIIKPLDYEDVYRNVLRFKIQVTDKRDNNATEPYHTAYSWVTVKVRDVNDNVPVFARHMTEVAVMEDAQVGTKVATFKATDRDGGGSSKISYRIGNDTDAARHFNINDNGELLIQRHLDREEIPRHKVHILAVDDGSPPKTSTATITVFVQDVNDNAPQLLRNYQPVIPENTPPSEIIEVFATDADDYSRHNGPPFLFRMDPTADDNTKSSFRIDFKKRPSSENASPAHFTHAMGKEQRHAACPTLWLWKQFGETFLCFNGSTVTAVFATCMA